MQQIGAKQSRLGLTNPNLIKGFPSVDLIVHFAFIVFCCQTQSNKKVTSNKSSFCIYCDFLQGQSESWFNDENYSATWHTKVQPRHLGRCERCDLFCFVVKYNSHVQQIVAPGPINRLWACPPHFQLGGALS